jgi:hypothetical protein
MGRSTLDGVSDGEWAVFAERIVAERDAALKKLEDRKLAGWTIEQFAIEVGRLREENDQLRLQLAKKEAKPTMKLENLTDALLLKKELDGINKTLNSTNFPTRLCVYVHHDGDHPALEILSRDPGFKSQLERLVRDWLNSKAMSINSELLALGVTE